MSLLNWFQNNLAGELTADSPSDLASRVEELERGLQGMQRQLADTQERLDFAERLLAKRKEERPSVGS